MSNKTLDEVRDALDSLRKKADGVKTEIGSIQAEADKLLSLATGLPVVGSYASAVKSAVDGTGYLATAAIVAIDTMDDAVDSLDPKPATAPAA